MYVGVDLLEYDIKIVLPSRLVTKHFFQKKIFDFFHTQVDPIGKLTLYLKELG